MKQLLIFISIFFLLSLGTSAEIKDCSKYNKSPKKYLDCQKHNIKEKDPTELTMEEALILIEKRKEYDKNKKNKKSKKNKI